MSEAPVEIVRAAFAAYSGGGLEAVMPSFAPDAVWYFDADEWVEDLAYRGHDGIRAAHAVWVSNLEGFGWEVHEIRDLGERVLVLADITGSVRDSGAPARVSMNLIVEVGGDLVREVHTFMDLQRALAAAEVRPPAGGVGGSPNR